MKKKKNAFNIIQIHNKKKHNKGQKVCVTVVCHLDGLKITFNLRPSSDMSFLSVESSASL